MFLGRNDDKDPHDGEYIGNIFGWRLSIIGAILLLLVGSLAVYRHHALGIPFGNPDPSPEEPATPPLDTFQGEAIMDSLRRN